MSLSTLPLSYCTNVHPGRTLAEVLSGLEQYTAPVRRELDAPLAAGLWLARPVIDELTADSDGGRRLRESLERLDLCCYTLNAFPYGDFHQKRVKEQVYLPDWTDDRRRVYTEQCARVLASLLQPGREGSLSTVPLGFKEFQHAPDFLDRCIDQLLQLVRSLDDLHDETGQVIRLAIEPEPYCVLETTPETLAFFEQLRQRAAERDLLNATERHVGVCYDVCHQSVEFENVDESIRALEAADVRINKVHITCALRLPRPMENAEGRTALARFAEPRYLHQTLAWTNDGRIVREVDLTSALCETPSPDFAAAAEWRTHFHVPVNAESLGPLQTTRDDLQRALAAVAKLAYAPQLEVETYTWNVLPGESPPSLVDRLSQELRSTRALLDQIRS